MRNLQALVSLLLLCGATATELSPRGSRPVEPATRSESCDSQDKWSLCADEQWGPKCPSGCRIQGLMDRDDHNILKRIENIRKLLEQNQLNYRSTDRVSKQTYDFLREKLTVESGHDTNYYNLAQNLRTRISELKIKIDQQLQTLAAMKDRVRDQVLEMQRLEVDIDMKLRSCKGSCASYVDYQVDGDSYVELEKQVYQLDAQSPDTVVTAPGTMYVMKSRQLQDSASDPFHKSGTIRVGAQQQRVEMFPEVTQVKFVLEEEGSRGSPATISKDTGTSFSSSSSGSTGSFSSSSSSSSHSSKSISELDQPGNGGLFTGNFETFGQPSTSHMTTSTSTSTITCSKRIEIRVVHTKDGPVEERHEVIEGGPECQAMADMTKGGSFLPSITETSSSTLTTKTIHSDTKGSLTTGSNDDRFGFDLGGFMTDDPDDDVPDFHARSVKSGRVERQANYVGKGTKDVE